MNAKIYVHRSAAAIAAALVLVAGCKQSEDTTTTAPGSTGKPAKPAIVSAEKNSFAEVTSKLDPGGNLYVYLSTEQLMSNLSNYLASASNMVSAMPQMAGADMDAVGKVFTVLGEIANNSGISEISGLGASSIAREKGFYYNKLIIHHYPGQNAGPMWTMFGRSPHPLKIMDFLPISTAMASSADFDLGLAWTNIVQGVKALNIPDAGPQLEQLPAQFHELTGLDLSAALQSLGGEYGMILTLDPSKSIELPLGDKPVSIPSPGLCLVWKVNSDLIFDRVDKWLGSNALTSKLLIKADETGLKMRTVLIPFPLPIPLELHPSIARVGDYLLLATSDTLIREMVAVNDGKKKGFKTTEAFKKLSQGVPLDGNFFSLVTGVFARTMGQIQEMAMSSQNMNTEALKSFQQMMQTNNVGSFSVSANGPEGWEAVGNSGSVGPAMPAVPAVAVAGVLRAFAFPNHAKSTGQRGADIDVVPQAVGGVGDVFLRPVLQSATLLLRQGADDFGGRAQHQ